VGEVREERDKVTYGRGLIRGGRSRKDSKGESMQLDRNANSPGSAKSMGKKRVGRGSGRAAKRFWEVTFSSRAGS